eukprot:TRINITY_DN24390_c0_g2_i1.p1 TRINITY_DN24390_c0_g2~~TRINITY_DN24390_c0_g2_i1.p1  ORF type:complete len:122 (-),score=22.69 TRINITY_DN24390_c0_g2_i1:400-765(-)
MSSGLSPSSSQTERDQASKMNSTSTTASNLGGEDAADAETATESDLPVRRPSTRTKTSGGRMSTQNLAFIAADLQAMAEALALAAKEATEDSRNVTDAGGDNIPALADQSVGRDLEKEQPR